MNNKPNILFDSNIIFYKVIFSASKKRKNLLKNQSDINDFINEVHQSFTETIDDFKLNCEFDRLIFVRDSALTWRKIIYPDYKAKRNKKFEFDIVNFNIAFNEYFKLLNYHNIYALDYPRFEGDDLLYFISALFHKNKKS